MLLSKTFKNSEKLRSITTFHNFSHQVQIKLFFQAFLDFRYHGNIFFTPEFSKQLQWEFKFYFRKKG